MKVIFYQVKMRLPPWKEWDLSPGLYENARLATQVYRRYFTELASVSGIDFDIDSVAIEVTSSPSGSLIAQTPSPIIFAYDSQRIEENIRRIREKFNSSAKPQETDFLEELLPARVASFRGPQLSFVTDETIHPNTILAFLRQNPTMVKKTH